MGIDVGFGDPNFWSSFWPGFWANLASAVIIGLVATLVIGRIVDRIQKVEAIVNYSDSLTENEREHRWQFYVENRGNRAFGLNSIYWHVFIPENVEVRSTNPPYQPHFDNALNISGIQYRAYRGEINVSLFPQAGNDFFQVVLRVPDEQQYKPYYRLSTAFGEFPKTRKRSKNGTPGIGEVTKRP